MRPQLLIPLFLLSASAIQVPSLFADFYEPQVANETSVRNELHKRDGSCPVNFNSCTTLGKKLGGACCTVGSYCTTDRSNNIACCLEGATCTGSLTLASGTAGGPVLGGGATLPPVSATTTSNPTATITDGASVSYVANAYFPFPYIPTTYANSAACNSAYNACQSNYAACTANLAGNGFGVTVIAPGGGGVTVAPTAVAVGAASATSICSSLSGQACFSIASDSCAVFGGGSFSNGGDTSAAARPNANMGFFAAAAMVLGIARQIV